MHVVLILIASILTGNIALTYFLGMCPFITISRNLRVAAGMGVAVTAVMVLTATANWLIQHWVLVPLGLTFLSFLVFIVTIAAIVQVLELLLDRYLPTLHQAFGIFLPLITVNCAILGISLFMVLRSYTFRQTVFYSLGSGLGWLLAIVTMGALRRRLVFCEPLERFGDAGITSILAGIMALAFIGFAGMADL